MRDSFTAAMDALEDEGFTAARYSDPFVAVLPVTGAAVSTLGHLLGSETISATDAGAAHLDEVQFDLGEGPCWDALRLVRPVTEPSLTTRGRLRWPAFAAAVVDDAVRSVFAFPLAVGTLRIGAVDLYSRESMILDPLQMQRAEAMAEVVGRRVLRDALNEVNGGSASVNPRSRRMVHQATGFVIAQLQVAADDAQLVIEGHAFAASRSTMDVAQDIIDGRLSFVRRDGRIEAIG
ncbi:GAF domain-containing protein [Microbacterium sp. CFBP9034]|uniref:GAF domain-containing protein n=1 Tax=Microbacterium sp. CFBP9034 TaxID=3096540 RepID=UPI002A6B3A34|nr:GAF domain-containing protein [Microbacterium sp. CFBP9034]MDY0910448.1 GAF domain-containing protein [Microbacterium sp. CFBP9034]